jgi:hypothetical protein
MESDTGVHGTPVAHMVGMRLPTFRRHGFQPVGALLVLLFSVAACVSPSKDERASTEPAPTFVVHGGYANDAERVAVEENLRRAGEFLKHWADLGVSPAQLPLHVYVEPPASLTGHDRLVSVLGPAIDSELDGLGAKIVASKSGNEIIALLTTFACDHPILLPALVPAEGDPQRFAANIDLALDDTKTSLAATIASIRESSLTAPSEYVVQPWLRCGALSLARGRAGEHTTQALDLSIMLHELGHALHDGRWLAKSGPSALPRGSATVEEAVADVFAGVYLNDPCIGPALAADGDGTCLRHLDRHDATLSDAELRLSGISPLDEHDTGDALRHGMWTLARGVSPDTFDHLLIAGLDGVAGLLSTPTAIGGFADTDDSQKLDPFVSFALRYVRGYDQGAALLEGACASSSGACGSPNDFLGERRDDVIGQLLANAPVTVGAAGKDVVAGNKRVHVAFSFDADAARWRATLSGDVAVTSTLSGFAAIAKSTVPAYAVRFSTDSGALEGTWSSSGALTLP